LPLGVVKRPKIARCRAFATPVSLQSLPAIALEKSSRMLFGRRRCTRHFGRLRSETSTPRANCDIRFRIDDRQILISASANFLQRLRTAMVFTSSHCDAIDDRSGWKALTRSSGLNDAGVPSPDLCHRDGERWLSTDFFNAIEPWRTHGWCQVNGGHCA
jgi:hypothetical protein